MPERVEQRVDQLNREVVRLYAQGRHVEALALANQSCDLARRDLGESNPHFATSLNNLAELYRSMGDSVAAEPLLCRALEIRRRALGEEHPDFSASLNNLATLFDSMGKYAAAEPLHRQALDIVRKTLGEEHPDFASSLSNLASLYRSMGKYAAAEPLYRQALEILRKARDHNFPSCLNNLASLYRLMGKYAAAEPLYREALEIRRRVFGEGHPAFAESLNSLAVLYHSMNNFAAAEPLYCRALEIRRKVLGDEHPDFAISLSNLASLYRSMGKYAAAEPLYRQALEIQRKAPDRHSEFVGSLQNLAELYQFMGNYTAAELLYRQVLDIRRKVLGDEHPDFALTMSNLAGLYQLVGKYAAAEPLYRQALEILRKAETTLDFAAVLNNLAVLSVATERENEALALMLQAAAVEDQMIGQVFSISSESQRMAYISAIQTNVDAFLSLVLGYLSDSAEAVHAAVDLVLRRKAVGAEALAAQRDAVLGGKYPALEPSLRDLTTLRMQIAQKTLAGPGGERIEVYQKELAEWNARKERLEADLARQIPEMNVARKLRAADRRAVALALPEGTALVEFVRFNVFDFNAVEGRGELQWKPARYLAFVLVAGQPDNAHMIDLGEVEAIDQMIATFRAGITGESESRDSQDVQSRPTPAPKVSQVLELRAVVFDPLLAALGGRKHLLLAPDGDLSRLPFEVLPTRDGGRLIDDYHISYLGAGRDVLRFRAAKSGRPKDPLVVADPDLDLEGEALAAGPSGRAEAAPSGPKSKVGFWSRLLAREGVAPASPASLAAHPTRTAAQTGRRSRDLDPRTLHFEPLPGTRVEGEQVAAILGVRPWLGGAALESPLKACDSPRMLHLATHGFFLQDQRPDPNRGRGQQPGAFGGEPSNMLEAALENPLLRSGLVLAGFNTWCRGGSLPPEAEDGLLTAEDVSGLNLLDTDLVVLSACETGLGKVRTGEGVFGLRRAFVLAGTKGLIMSLWKVPDEETGKLMEDFYHRILREQPGQSRPEALRAAQLAMKEKEEYRHPLYWGAFIYEGDPGIPS
jgi:tetratricopeptide (TPR) repeat protein